LNVQDVISKFNNREKLEYVFFWKSNSYFSNWYPSDFEVDGIVYWCVEQYMMAKKAELFRDYNSFRDIMASNSQKEIKALGRKVMGFNEEIWSKNRERIVFEGNYAKFTQNPKLKSYILKQKGKIFVEASPYDKIWGIGLDDSDLNFIYNPNNWRGLNLLGFVLMDVRDKILLESGC
jgi:ribA/ribD-fused uncharacterized protein